MSNTKFLWSDIPSDFPDISMLHLTEAQLKNMKHISLVDAIMEGRRRLKVAAKTRRAEMKLYANTMREKEAAMPDAAATPPTSTGTTSAPDTGAIRGYPVLRDDP